MNVRKTCFDRLRNPFNSNEGINYPALNLRRVYIIFMYIYICMYDIMSHYDDILAQEPESREETLCSPELPEQSQWFRPQMLKFR